METTGEGYKPWYNPMESLGKLQITSQPTLTYSRNGVFVQNMPNGPLINPPEKGKHQIVDHYYYPDSDLETIVEESSVLDSEEEEDRAIQAFPTSSTSTNASDSDNTTPENLSPVTDLPGNPSNFFKPVDIVNRSPQSNNQLISPNPVNLQTVMSTAQETFYFSQPRLEPPSIGAQKIIYAKCLSPKEKHQIAPSPPETTGSTISSMFEAAKSGDVFALNSFSASELNDTLDENGNTALHVAAEHGHLNCVRRLVSTASPHMITLPNDNLMTSTALAVKNGHSPCVQWLVKRTSARDELSVSNRASSFDGSTTRPPLAHTAAKYNRSDILDWLCEEMKSEGYSVDTADHCSNTAVHFAAQHGHMECIQTLVARGASVTLMNSDGDTPCQAAQKNGHDCCVGYLVVVETCVSLAQQVVALRNDVESMKSENEKLRGEMASMHQPSHRAAELCANNDRRMTNGHEPPSNGINYSAASKISPNTPREAPSDKQVQQNGKTQKRFLEEQPPPPKLWTSKKINNHLATDPKQSSSTPKIQNSNVDEYQRRINAALNGPGTDLGREQGSEQNVQKPNPRLNGLHKETSSSSDSEQANREVEMLTKNEGAKKPWEKLSMDEMLKRVRDVRYLPSPTISHCTEDSTMETVEVMRERLAAASRWFLVEQARGQGIRPRPPGPHQHKKNQIKSNPNPINKGVTSKRPTTSSSTAKWVLQSQPEQKQLNKVPPAHQNNREPNHQTQTRHDDQNGSKQASTTQPTSPTKTGTLKFMVSHPKSPKNRNNKKDSPRTPDKKSSSTFSTPKSSTSMSPEGTPPGTPTSSTTQRTGSYRRAINKQPKQVNELRSSSDSLSSSTGGTVRSSSSEGSKSSRSKTSTDHETELSSKALNFHGLDDPLKKKSHSNSAPLITQYTQYVTPQIQPFQHSSTYSGTRHNSEQVNNVKKTSPFVGEYRKVDFTPRKSASVTSRSYVDKTHNYDSIEDSSPQNQAQSNYPAKQVSFFRRVQGKLK